MTAREEVGEWRGYPAYSSPYYISRYRSHHHQQQQYNPRRDGKEAGEEAGGEKPERNLRNVVTRPRWESTTSSSMKRPTYESRPLVRAREGIASYSCKAVLLVVSVLLMAGIITALIVIGINIDPKQTMASRFSLARVKNRGMGSDRFEGGGDASKQEQEGMRAVVRDYAPYDYRDSIGAVMEGRDKTDLVQVVTAKVGYPAKSMRMVISFSSHLSYVPLAVVAESTTYVTKEYMVMSSSSNGSFASSSAYSINTKYGSDIVSLAGLTMRVPITCDDSAYSEILAGLCKDCQGVLGLGASSPFWMIWSMVRVGAGPLPIDIEIGDQLEREKARGRTSMCIAFPWAQELATHRLPPPSIDTSYDRKMEFETFTGQNSDYRLSLIPVMGNKDDPLCMVQAYVFGDEYLVDLSFSGMRTILPSKVYWKFVGENSISSTTTKMAKRSEARETQAPEEYDEVVFKAVDPRDGDEGQMQRYYSRNRRGKRNSDGSRPPPPPSLSKDFSGKRSHHKHQDGDLEWRDLVIDFVTTDGNGSSSSSRNSVRIRMKDLIVHKSRSTDANPTSVDLLLIPDDGPLTAYGNVIRLGRSTMYSISADVYPGRGIAVVDQWFINRNWSPIDLMVMFVFVIMFIRWPMTRNRINGKLVRRHRSSKQSNRSRYYPLALVLWVKKIFLIGDSWVIQFDEQQSDSRNDKRHHRYKFESFYVIGKRNMYIKMMIEVLTTFALIGVYASSETQHAISPFEAFDIYVLIAMITLIAIEYATVLFTVVLDKVHWISGITEYEDAPRTLPYRPSDRDDQASVEGGNSHPPIFMHEAQLKRLSVMRNFCHQCVTVFILWLVLLHVREQTLATVSSLVASSALFFVAVYFTIIVLVSPVKPFAWMWGVFVSYQVLFLIYTGFICEVYVLRYFIEDVVYNRNPSLLIVMSIAFYTAIATLAAWTYRVSCNDDEYTQLVKEDARMGEMVLEKKPQTNNKG